MIVWGWGKKIISLGFARIQHCPTCEKDRDFLMSVVYSYFSIFWIPILSWGTKYYYHCSICDRGIEVNKKELSSLLNKNPIPWFHRFGWLAIAALVVVLILVFGVFGGGGDNEETYRPVTTARPIVVVTPALITLPTPSLIPVIPVITPIPIHTVQPIPTIASLRTPTPSPKPVVVLFKDDFSNDYSGWDTYSDEEGSAFYKNGWLHIKDYLFGQHSENSFANRYFTDFVLEIETKLVDGSDDNWHGIICRYNTGGNYYDFGISADGYYVIQKWVNGVTTVLKGPTSSIYINTGQEVINLVRVECVGGNLSLSVNRHLLAQVTDYTFTGGDIALGAEALGSEFTEVAFDNILIAAP